MNKKIKIILFAILAATLILVGKFAYDNLVDYCPRCKKPVAPNEVLKITKDYTSLAVVYSKNNGSLPPAYHRENIFTITTNEKGEISGEYIVRDSDKVIDKKPLVISSEQLQKVIMIAGNINPTTDESVNLGCTGGSAKSIEISQNNEVLLETSAYNCAGKSTNEDLEKFSAQIEKLLSGEVR